MTMYSSLQLLLTLDSSNIFFFLVFVSAIWAANFKTKFPWSLQGHLEILGMLQWFPSTKQYQEF